ncbi:unnamed protein product [Rotaria sordida]|uniref:Uncharacterized protein n=1 Tax=Rotaria sordida TaxID=392033 RepID=A0A815L3K7_9BILA|nr:unnamed protein product [Rotaria sordida]CAF1379215.1 unnamed protein product [Rotaria sordida]CAF1404563.1 unnamed protein product [Rotaria sordida]CAF3675455.1 unnamed protein product [Rotaria sordida]CAF3863728.1 unnamed protein product [Rotaria sordida]
MVDGLIELIFNLTLWTFQGICIIFEAKEKTKSHQESSSRDRSKKSLSQLSPISSYPRAVLIASSSIKFGNDCERLVNIAFQTSQLFPTLMGTYADVNQYLCKELKKQYPDECFHIIIGENHGFGFSIDEDQYFAEIEQDRYRVLIYATKRYSHIKFDTHDANSQASFVWN